MAKNLLQELCQRQGHDLPIYHSTQMGPPHQPKWSSTVFLTSRSAKFFGDECSTKKSAETNAADKALKALSSSTVSTLELIPTVEIKKSVCLMVDVENLPKLISQLPIVKGPWTIYAFVGKHHPLASVDYNSEVSVVLSPSSHQDGTDTCMQVYTGMLLTLICHELYLIATRDHFGAALVEMIKTTGFGWRPQNAALVTSVDHILEALNGF